MRWLAALLLLLALPVAAQEQGPSRGAETIVAGLSQNQVEIKANFSGSEIMVYGAVRRESPPPTDNPLHVIVTVEGPPMQMTIRRKERVAGIWVNNASVQVDSAPSFYGVASTGPLGLILLKTEDQRYRITMTNAIRAVGISAEATNAPEFIEALLRVYEGEGRYRLAEDTVRFSEATLFRTDVILPANLTDGNYRVRIFLVRQGRVIDHLERDIRVRKAGLEWAIYNAAHRHSLEYAIVALLIAVAAGWAASEVFRRIRL
ncbi:MAG: TIGR02186 family protein [Paracoccaceae bacterium]